MELQLRDAMYSIITSLKAGLSMNSALIKCQSELERIHAGQKEKPMLEEFIKIKNDLSMGLSVDDALMNFKKRVNLDDVDDFVTSIVTVRQKGGNLIEVIDSTASMISDKIAIKMDIRRMTAGKKWRRKFLL
jgi:tight adherence protein B